MGNAIAMLCPYRHDASPRVPIEAAYCGTPTVCLNIDGTQDSIFEGVTGYACGNVEDMERKAKAIIAGALDRERVKEMAQDMFSFHKMMDQYETLLRAVRAGETW